MRDAARIQPAHANRIGFFAWHVSMPVQYDLNAGGHVARRDMHEEKAPALPLQHKRQRPEVMVLIVAQYHLQRFAQLLEFPQYRRITNITQMPNLIRCRQPTRQIGRKMIVGIGDDGDSKHPFSKQSFSTLPRQMRVFFVRRFRRLKSASPL